jgi:hypothetical protein
VIFLGLSFLSYGLLTLWLTGHTYATPEEWGYTLGHLTAAALINAHLFFVARRRNLSFLASAPLAFLMVSQFYFTVNGIKYFSPILLYPQFDLSLTAQFVGSIAGAAVLFLCSLLLYHQTGPTTGQMRVWLTRYWPDVTRLMIGSMIGSLLCKLVLLRLGYGSAYTDTAYYEHAVRSYGDYLILLGNDVFGALTLVFGCIYLCRPRRGRVRPLGFALALAGVLLQVAYALLYLKARMILLVAFISLAAALEFASRRRAERALQALLLVLPPLSLLGVQLTLLIGRINLPEEAGIRLAIAAVNRRAELTDFAVAMMVDSRGQAHDASIVTAAVLNAIPRAVFPGKQQVVRDVYSDILEQRLGWPAGAGEDMEADYLDTAFSDGVMSFGMVGFLILPLALVWSYGWLGRRLERNAHGLAYGLTLIPLWLVAMHIEGEWASIPLNLRQAVFYALICLGLAVAARLIHQVVVVASRSASMTGAESSAPALGP